MDHAFFKDIDWDAIDNKTAPSPFHPPEVTAFNADEVPEFKNYDDAMQAFDLAMGIFGGEADTHVRSREQKLFRNWEFVRTAIIAEEHAIYTRKKKEKEEEVAKARELAAADARAKEEEAELETPREES